MGRKRSWREEEDIAQDVCLIMNPAQSSHFSAAHQRTALLSVAPTYTHKELLESCYGETH